MTYTLQQQLKYAMVFYSTHIIPRFQKNKSIGISAAVIMSLIYLFRERVMKPPKQLRHIPHINFFSVFRSLFTGESFWERAYRVVIPFIDSPKSNGLFLETGRYGWELYVCNPEDAKRVFLKQDLFPKYPVTEGVENTLFTRFITGENIIMSEGAMWKSQRKVANPAFHRSMPVKLFGQLTQEMFVAMESMNEIINITDLMQRWTLDAIGKAGFGFEFNAISDLNSEWVKTYENVSTSIDEPLFFIFPKLDREYVWLFPTRVKAHKEMDKLLSMIDNVIENKRELLLRGETSNDALEENEKDLLTLMLESENRGEGVMSNLELKGNICAFFLAGHDTTSSTLSFAIHYLAQNQEIQQRAREEAIAILGDEPVDVFPTVEETKQMDYINQIMKETMRINGPIPTVVPRVATEDTELSGTFVPKGTLINVSIFNIHHSEKYWKNSQEFNPDRFSLGGEADTNVQDGISWLPFGYGGRQCIGMNFSLNEQRVLLSMLLRKYSWTTPQNSIHKDRVVSTGMAVIVTYELDIKFKKRY
ncbi:cytochrome P450 [Helicostylum pulchrum]|nr:cytochrome P450 [Helicostylum pulchrum]